MTTEEELPDIDAHDVGKKAEEEKIFKPEDVVAVHPGTLCWKFFHFKEQKNKDGSGQGKPCREKAYCNICGKDLAYGGTTSTLNGHMSHKHSKEWDAVKNEKKMKEEEVKKKIQKITNFATNAQNNNVKTWPKTSVCWQTATKLFAEWTCESTRTAEMADDPGFHRFLNYLVPEYEIPCPNTLRNRYDSEYERILDIVIKELEEVEFVSLTTDGGTSSNAVSFLDINAHYIDKNFEMKSVVLAVRENKESHTAENYRKKTDEVVEEFSLKDKVVLTTTDNENKMRAAFKDHERNGCLAHQIHNSVTEAVTGIKVVDDAIMKLRKVARLHNKSYKFRYNLQVEQEKLGIKKRPLLQDVPTRWGSTRASSGSFLTHKDDLAACSTDERFKNFEAINSSLMKHSDNKTKDKRNLMFSESEMIKVENLNKFLTSIDVYSTTLGGNKFVTSSIVLPVVAAFKHDMKKCDEDPWYIAEMKEKLLQDFTERTAINLNFDVLQKCTALDPRFKNLKVVDKRFRNKIFDDLESEMQRMRINDENVAAAAEKSCVEVERLSKKPKVELNFSESESEDDDDREEMCDVIKKEIKVYRNEPLLARDEEVLPYWAKNKDKFPHLARIAKKYLCVMATSTEAERTFSALGLLLTKQRLCMTGENINKQLFLRDKYKKM